MATPSPLLLDTHAWLWYSLGERSLGSNARKAIDAAQANAKLYVSVASCWEIGQLVAKKRLSLSLPIRSWMHRSIQSMELKVIDLRRRQVMDAVDMIGQIESKDPFNSFILAAAAHARADLVSADGHMKNYAKSSGYLGIVDARK